MQDCSSHSHWWASSQLQLLLKATAYIRQTVMTATVLTASKSPPATPAALAPSVLAAALEPARGLCWQRWPGHYHPANRAVLAQQLKLDRTYKSLFLKPVERAVLANVLSLTNRATVDTKGKMKTACKAGRAQKLQRQKDEKEESLRRCLLPNQENGANEQEHFIKKSVTLI